jgi:hypothetical protein
MFIILTTATVIGSRNIDTVNYEEYMSQLTRVSNSVNEYIVKNNELPVTGQIIGKANLTEDLTNELANNGDSNNDLSNLLKHKTKRTQLSSFIDGRTISIKKIREFPTHPNFKQIQYNNNSPKQNQSINNNTNNNNDNKGQTTLCNFITANDNDNTKQINKESNDNIIQQLMNIKAKAKEIQDQYNLTDMERECEICYFKRDKHDFSKSKCGHVVCNPCWNNWLKEKLECPLCKKKVRAKTLEPLIH